MAKDPVSVAQDVKALSLADVWRLFIDTVSRYKELLDTMSRKLNEASQEGIAPGRKEELVEECAKIKIKLDTINKTNISMMKEGALFLVSDYVIWTFKFLMFFVVAVVLTGVLQGFSVFLENPWFQFPPWIMTFIAMMLLSLWFWRSVQILGRRMYPFVVSFFPGSLQYLYYLLFVPEEVSLKGFAAVFWAALSVIAISIGITMGASVMTLVFILVMMVLVFLLLFAPFFKNFPRVLGTALTFIVIVRAMNSVLEYSLNISITELSLIQSSVLVGSLLLFVMWFDLMVHMIVFVSFSLSWRMFGISKMIPVIGLEVPEEVTEELKKDVKTDILEETKKGIRKVLEQVEKHPENFTRMTDKLTSHIIDKSTGQLLLTVKATDKRFQNIEKADMVVQKVTTGAKKKANKVLTIVSKENNHWVVDSNGNPVIKGPIKGPFQALGGELAKLARFKDDPGVGKFKKSKVTDLISMDGDMKSGGIMHGVNDKNKDILGAAFGEGVIKRAGTNKFRFDRVKYEENFQKNLIASMENLSKFSEDSDHQSYSLESPGTYLLPSADGKTVVAENIGKNKYKIGGADVTTDDPEKFLNFMKDAEGKFDELTLKKIEAGETTKIGNAEISITGKKNFWGGGKRQVRIKDGKTVSKINAGQLEKLKESIQHVKKLDAGQKLFKITADSTVHMRNLKRFIENDVGTFWTKDGWLQIKKNKGFYGAIGEKDNVVQALSSADKIGTLVSRLRNDHGYTKLVPTIKADIHKELDETGPELVKAAGILSRRGHPITQDSFDINDKSVKKRIDQMRKRIKQQLGVKDNDPVLKNEIGKLESVLKNSKGGQLVITKDIASGNKFVSVVKSGEELYRSTYNKKQNAFVSWLKDGGGRGYLRAGKEIVGVDGRSVGDTVQKLGIQSRAMAQNTPTVTGEVESFNKWASGLRNSVISAPRESHSKLMDFVAKPVGSAGQMLSKRDDVVNQDTDVVRLSTPSGTFYVQTVKAEAGESKKGETEENEHLILDSQGNLTRVIKTEDEFKDFMMGKMNNLEVTNDDPRELSYSIDWMQEVANQTGEPGKMRINNRHGDLVGLVYTDGKTLHFNKEERGEWKERSREQLNDMLGIKKAKPQEDPFTKGLESRKGQKSKEAFARKHVETILKESDNLDELRRTKYRLMGHINEVGGKPGVELLGQLEHKIGVLQKEPARQGPPQKTPQGFVPLNVFAKRTEAQKDEEEKPVKISGLFGETSIPKEPPMHHVPEKLGGKRKEIVEFIKNNKPTGYELRELEGDHYLIFKDGHMITTKKLLETHEELGIGKPAPSPEGTGRQPAPPTAPEPKEDVKPEPSKKTKSTASKTPPKITSKIKILKQELATEDPEYRKLLEGILKKAEEGQSVDISERKSHGYPDKETVIIRVNEGKPDEKIFHYRRDTREIVEELPDGRRVKITQEPEPLEESRPVPAPTGPEPQKPAQAGSALNKNMKFITDKLENNKPANKEYEMSQIERSNMQAPYKKFLNEKFKRADEVKVVDYDKGKLYEFTYRSGQKEYALQLNEHGEVIPMQRRPDGEWVSEPVQMVSANEIYSRKAHTVKDMDEWESTAKWVVTTDEINEKRKGILAGVLLDKLKKFRKQGMTVNERIAQEYITKFGALPNPPTTPPSEKLQPKEEGSTEVSEPQGPTSAAQPAQGFFIDHKKEAIETIRNRARLYEEQPGKEKWVKFLKGIMEKESDFKEVKFDDRLSGRDKVIYTTKDGSKREFTYERARNKLYEIFREEGKEPRIVEREEKPEKLEVPKKPENKKNKEASADRNAKSF